MQKKTKIALGAAAIAGIAAIVGASQFAHADRGFGMGGWGHGHGRGGGMMMDMAERYDANKDGSITQDEITTNRAAAYGEFDADKNNAMTLQEFQNLWLKMRNEQMVREFQRFDANGDGNLTLDEYQRPLANIVAEMDQNGDKALSLEDRRMMRGGRHQGGPGMPGPGMMQDGDDQQ